VYTRDSSPSVVAATQEAFRRWHKARYGGHAELRTPIRIPRGQAAPAADGDVLARAPAAGAAAAAVLAADGTAADGNPRKRNLEGQFRAAAATAGPDVAREGPSAV
jgi:hypothetical protein